MNTVPMFAPATVQRKGAPMLKRLFLLAFSASIAVATSASAQSFDCHANRHVAEQTVCDHDDLKALDNEMAQLHLQIVNDATSESYKKLRRRQNDWLDDRNACGASVDCLRNIYKERIRDFRQILGGETPSEFFGQWSTDKNGCETNQNEDATVFIIQEKEIGWRGVTCNIKKAYPGKDGVSLHVECLKSGRVEGSGDIQITHIGADTINVYVSSLSFSREANFRLTRCESREDSKRSGSAAPDRPSRESSLFAIERWIGEEERGTFGYAIILPETTILARSGMDEDLPRSISCTLPYKALFNPWNRAGNGLRNAHYYTAARIERLVAKHDFKFRTGDVNAPAFTIQAGQIIEYLFKLSDNTLLFRINGNQYYDNNSLFEHVERAPAETHPQEEWLRLTCANGPEAWIPIKDLCVLSGNGVSSCTPGILAVEPQGSKNDGKMTDLTDAEVEGLKRLVGVPVIPASNAILKNCYMDHCSFTKIDSVTALIKSKNGTLYTVSLRTDYVKAPTRPNGTSGYAHIEQPKTFNGPAGKSLVHCSRQRPAVVWDSSQTSSLRRSPYVLNQIQVGDRTNLRGANVLPHSLYWAVCMNDIVDQSAFYTEDVAGRARRLGYQPVWPSPVAQVEMGSMAEVLKYLGISGSFQLER